MNDWEKNVNKKRRNPIMEQLIQKPVKRNILLNPGPSTTTDTVKYAQVVPDICPREKEFGGLMKGLREDLVKIVHGDLEKYTSVLFCGSGTINIDACISSLLPEGGKVLVVDNGAYSTRAVEVCQYYGLPYIDLKFPVDELPDLEKVEQTLERIRTLPWYIPLITRPAPAFSIRSVRSEPLLINIMLSLPWIPPLLTPCVPFI